MVMGSTLMLALSTDPLAPPTVLDLDPFADLSIGTWCIYVLKQ